jgi:hypothetical protein
MTALTNTMWAYPQASPRWRALAASQRVPRSVIRAFAHWYTKHQGRHDRVAEKLRMAREPEQLNENLLIRGH